MNRLARNLAWSSLFLGKSIDPARWYDLLGERVLGAEPGTPLANMGYWAGRPSSLLEASKAMFTLVAEGAELSSQVGHVVDAGCGFGLNTLASVSERQVGRASGLNISAYQVGWARRHVEEQGLTSRVEFLEASATAMPFPAASIDAVISIEAAFHFDSRAAFFREAGRVLRPGGRLSMVDLLSLPPRHLLSKLVLEHVRRGVQMPAANVVSEADYRRELEDAGFEVEHLEFIEAEVVPHFRRWFFRQPLRVLLGSYDFAMMLGNASYFVWPWRYPRVVARRR